MNRGSGNVGPFYFKREKNNLEVEKGDSDHQDAVENMQGLSPEEQQEKFAEYMEICAAAFRRD